MTEGHARADREQPVGVGGRFDPDSESAGRPPHEYRVADGFRRRDQQQPLGIQPGAPRVCDGSCLGSVRIVRVRPASRTRRPARRASTRAATPTRPAGCRAFPPRSARVPARLTERGPLSPAARARHYRADPRPPALGNPSSSSPGHASRTAARPTPPTVASRRTGVPAPRLDRATARHRPDTRAAAPRPRPPADSVPPTPPGSGPARARRATRTPRRARLLGGRKPIQAIQHRRAQLLQRRERKLHLRLHTDRPHHPEPRRRPGSQTAAAPSYQPRARRSPPDPALPTAHRLKQPLQRLALVAPACSTSAGPSMTMQYRPYRARGPVDTPVTTRFSRRARRVAAGADRADRRVLGGDRPLPLSQSTGGAVGWSCLCLADAAGPLDLDGRGEQL